MNDYNPNKTEEIVHTTYTRREILRLVPIKGLIKAIFSGGETPNKEEDKFPDKSAPQ